MSKVLTSHRLGVFLQRRGELRPPCRGNELRAREPLDDVIEFPARDGVDGVVAREGRIELVVHHPFDDVFEVLDRLLVRVAGEFEGDGREIGGRAEGAGVVVVVYEVLFVFVKVARVDGWGEVGVLVQVTEYGGRVVGLPYDV